jgi:hypothetical protein
LFRKLEKKIINDVIANLVEFYGSENVSDITWLEKGPDEEIMDVLDDVRDCTFKTAFYIPDTLAEISNPFHFGKQVNTLDRVYLTPHFFLHFEIKGISELERLVSITRFMSLQLGF